MYCWSSPKHSQKLHPWNSLSQLSDSSTQRILAIVHSLYSYLAGLGRHGSQRLPASHEPPTSVLGKMYPPRGNSSVVHLAAWPPAVPASHAWQQQCAGVSGERALPWKSTLRAEEEMATHGTSLPSPFVLGWTNRYSSQVCKKLCSQKQRCKEKERKLKVEENFGR